jgi:hypothetical protein
MSIRVGVPANSSRLVTLDGGTRNSWTFHALLSFRKKITKEVKKKLDTIPHER